MAGESKFSHITVTEDEEEFVIQAGVRPESVQSEPQAQISAEKEQPASVTHEACEQAPVDSVEEAALDEDASRSSEPSAKNTYREASAEDLKADPMPVAQKVVIAAAIVLVIAIVAYIMVLR